MKKPSLSPSTIRHAVLAVIVALAALAAYKAVLMVSRPRQGDVLRGQWNYTDQVRAQVLASRTGPQAVVMFGDSQIAYSGFEANGFANYGIGGDTVGGLASRIPAYDLSRARAVVIEIGINDWWHGGFDGLPPAYGDILAALPKGARVIAIAILPVNARAGRYFSLNGLQAARRQANAAIAAACGRRRDCHYLDPSDDLGGPDGLRPDYDGGDGLHLSAAGYRVLLARLAPMLPGTP